MDLHDRPFGGFTSSRPEREDRKPMARRVLKGVHQPVGAQNERECPPWGNACQSGRNPITEAITIRKRASPIHIRRNLSRIRVEWRIAEHMVETSSQMPWQPKHVGIFYTYTFFEAIGPYVFSCKDNKPRFNFDSADAAISNACGKTQGCDAYTTTQFQQTVTGFCRNRGCQHHRIGTGTKSFDRLTRHYAAAQKSVFGKVHQGFEATSGSASARTSFART